jgi:hypothetical protein
VYERQLTRRMQWRLIVPSGFIAGLCLLCMQVLSMHVFYVSVGEAEEGCGTTAGWLLVPCTLCVPAHLQRRAALLLPAACQVGGRVRSKVRGCMLSVYLGRMRGGL